ncbi:MAG: lactate utilization protein [Bacillota bacterium]
MKDYNQLAGKEAVNRTMAAFSEKGIGTHFVVSGQEAFELILELIPQGSSVMNGSSVTLRQIGYIDYLKSGQHKWRNLHEEILAEKDPEKQAELRKSSALSDFYLGSVHALTEDGIMLFASNSGSQLPHIVYTSPNLIFIASTKKICTDLEGAFKRLYDHVIPLENERAMAEYGVGTNPNKILIFQGESPMIGRHVHLILVDDDLGY